jgi:ribosomal-protein-alanine N-acetyltransferase
LRLRPIAEADVHFLHAAFSDPETMRFMDFPPTRTIAESARYLAPHLFVLPDWHATWALECPANGAVIGFVNYHHRENWNQRLEIGFCLARPFWGLGLMREAVDALLSYCFTDLGVERVEATTNPQNAAAIAPIEGLGFLRESGVMRRRQKVGAEFRDLVMYALLRGDWPRP